jgi:AcrR family transcriptional regulator
MFRSRGYEATSMNAIAARVGISAPSIYHYFPAKTDLLFEALYVPMLHQVEACRRAVKGLTAPEAVAAFVRTIVLFLLHEPAMQVLHGDSMVGMDVLAQSLPQAQREALHVLTQEHVHDLRDLILVGIAAGHFDHVDATAATFAVLSIAEGVTWFRPDGRLSQEDVADLYAHFAITMLSPRRA